GPVAFEFFGDELRKPGERALAHLGARDADHHSVVGADHDPGIDFRRAVGGTDDAGTKRQAQAERKAAADRSGSDHEGAAIELWSIIHGFPPHALAAAWMAARTCWKVPQRPKLGMAAPMPAAVGFG